MGKGGIHWKIYMSLPSGMPLDHGSLMTPMNESGTHPCGGGNKSRVEEKCNPLLSDEVQPLWTQWRRRPPVQGTHMSSDLEQRGRWDDQSQKTGNRMEQRPSASVLMQGCTALLPAHNHCSCTAAVNLWGSSQQPSGAQTPQKPPSEKKFTYIFQLALLSFLREVEEQLTGSASVMMLICTSYPSALIPIWDGKTVILSKHPPNPPWCRFKQQISSPLWLG